jgi:hypothetical protein
LLSLAHPGVVDCRAIVRDVAISDVRPADGDAAQRHLIADATIAAHTVSYQVTDRPGLDSPSWNPVPPSSGR